MQFALTYTSGTFDTRTKMMGRQSAGLGFLRAALQTKPERIWCYAASRGDAETFARDVIALCQDSPEIRLILWDQPARLANAGLLYRADPGISEDGWRRQGCCGARAYSICGVTHTLSSHSAMSTITGLLTAPVYPWDALICTSTAARDIVRLLFEAEMDKLRSRVGATNFVLPQLPVIPLGIHCSDFQFDDARRAQSRSRLGLAADDIGVLFAGRLSFHGKGHPIAVFLSLETAAGETSAKLTLILFGQFANKGIEDVFRSEAALFAPSIRLLVLDGANNDDRDAAWSGADIFTSLSDNVQETFGLTPVEAPARARHSTQTCAPSHQHLRTKQSPPRPLITACCNRALRMSCRVSACSIRHAMAEVTMLSCRCTTP